ELFGTGVNSGQTAFRLREAYGEYGPVLAGQTWSTFMDPDVFPDSIEYWGPNGMVFFRNIQVRYTPIDGDLQAAIAIEAPGSTQDLGTFQETIALSNVSARYPFPDVTAHLKYSGDWGHVQASGIMRVIQWDDLTKMPVDLSGGQVGWGVSGSAVLKFLGGSALK